MPAGLSCAVPQEPSTGGRQTIHAETHVPIAPQVTAPLDRHRRTRLGRDRWVVERALVWLSGYRRPTLRNERRADPTSDWCSLPAPAPATSS